MAVTFRNWIQFLENNPDYDPNNDPHHVFFRAFDHIPFAKKSTAPDATGIPPLNGNGNGTPKTNNNAFDKTQVWQNPDLQSRLTELERRMAELESRILSQKA